MTYRGVVLDLDGTIYRIDDPIPGARGAVESIMNRDIDVVFLSNNPVHSNSRIAERLDTMGFTIPPTLIRSSASVTAEYLSRNHSSDSVYFVGSSGLQKILEERGLTLTDDYTDPDLVLASIYRGFDYETLMEAAWALEHDIPFYGTDPDVTIPIEPNRTVPGSGAIVSAIGTVAGRDPDRFMGKPSETAISAVREALDVPSQDCLVVGDRPDTDLVLGQRAGMDTALVLTGVSGRADLDASDVSPDHVLESIADVPTLLS